MKTIQYHQLDILVCEPETTFVGVIQCLHGMMEYKERYLEVMSYFAKKGYVCVIHDHKGHGKNAETLGYFGLGDGWYQLIVDTKQVSDYIKEQYPTLPHILLGHSMGSMVARSYYKRYPSDIDAMVLTGAPYYDPLSAVAGIVSKAVLFFKGSKHPSKTLNKLFFMQANKKYKNLDWLSENAENVKAYLNDPLCGQLFTASGYYYLAKGMKDMHDYTDFKEDASQTPILFVAGADDPIIGGEKGLKDSMDVFKKSGFRDISKHIYENKRHEILLESNREEVYKNIVDWLNGYFKEDTAAKISKTS